MGKPDWKDAPEWAKWLAQDKDGDWFWWERKPLISPRCSYWMPSVYGKQFKRAPKGKINDEWKKSLERRP